MRRIVVASFCAIILIAYLLEYTSSKTKIPSVILFLLLGWVIKLFVEFYGFNIPDLYYLLPVVGSIGLMLIVLEGSLELEYNASKMHVIKRSFFGALLTIIGSVIIFSSLFYYFGHFDLKSCILNALPLSVISSAIAIPSSKSLSPSSREFIIYESSFSDILGVLIFNFFLLNETLNTQIFGKFALDIFIMLAISIGATFPVLYMLRRIKYHIKFLPIILVILLVYTLSRIYHLPGLLFILTVGLVARNNIILQEWSFFKKFSFSITSSEVQRFKDFNIEMTFLVRSIFFILFGFYIDTTQLLNVNTFLWAISIVGIIIMLRIIQLKSSKLPLNPLLWFAPRGLITTQLFLSITAINNISIVNKSLIIQIIVLSSLLVMIGTLTSKVKLKEAL